MDITLFGPPGSNREALKQALKSEFQLTDLGTLHWLLGLQIEYQPDSIALSQRTYIDKLLLRFGMMSCNPVTLPLDPNHKLRKYQEGDNIADISLYQQIIDSLMYLVIGARPDLAFAISLLSQFSSKPTVEHLGAAKRILRYIKGTRDHTLTYKRYPQLSLAGFTDSDHGGNRDDRKSTSGYIFQLYSNE